MTLPWVALSREEAVGALRRAGVRVRTDGERLIVRRAEREVVIAADEALDPESLRAILRASGIDYVLLVDNVTTPLPMPAPHIRNDGGD